MSVQWCTIMHNLYLFLHTVAVFNMSMDVMSEIKNKIYISPI